MKTTLYELTMDGIEISEMLTDSIGELTLEIEAKIEALLLKGPDTIEAAAMVVRQLESTASACEEEVKRLRERAKAFQDNADRLKARMTVALDAAFAGKIKTNLFTIWTQKSADRLIAETIPGITPEMIHAERPDLVRVKMELDREKCVAEFKARNPLPDGLVFEEKQGTRYCRIK